MASVEPVTAAIVITFSAKFFVAPNITAGFTTIGGFDCSTTSPRLSSKVMTAISFS